MLDAIEERIKQDDEIMVTQLTKMLGKRSFKILTRTVEWARKTLEWTFHDSWKSYQKSVAQDEAFHLNNGQTQEQRGTLAKHTVILGHCDIGKVLQIYRPFKKGYAQSYRS